MRVATVHKDAVLSVDGRYRYHLARRWDWSTPPLSFIMLNPSTADDQIDDPTIRRCIAFSRREGYGGIQVANLFAYRATDPKALVGNPNRVGTANDSWLETYLGDAQRCPLVAAWGAHKIARDRAAYIAERAAVHGVTLHCLGKTKDGAPRHPLYLKDDTPLEVWP